MQYSKVRPKWVAVSRMLLGMEERQMHAQSRRWGQGVIFCLFVSVFCIFSITPSALFAGSIKGWGSMAVDSNALIGSRFIAIAAGYGHSLALKSDGSIVGWGYNDSGQATPPAGNDFIAIAAGGYYSLALKSDGSIVGSGANSAGQATPPDGNNFIAITAGGYHSLALKSDGSIVGWGNNDAGQATPPDGNNFIAIAAGWHHSLALKSDGSIVGWGDNEWGQATPPAGNNFIAIAAGGLHSLALKSDGSIVGWGYNYYGQATPPAGNNFIAIAAGYCHSLALKSDGSIVGWGYNYYGQATPPAGNNFIAIAAGGHHSLALKSDGSIVGWGDNYYGQATPPAGNNFIAIAAGLSHSLALKSDGSIVGWGRNDYGQATPPAGNNFIAIAAGGHHSLALKSDGSIVAWGLKSYGQCDVPEPNNGFIAVAAGGSHSLGLKSDSSIVGWGYNFFGQCDVPEPNIGFIAVTAGESHSLGLKADGSIVAWGRKGSGQCDVPEPNTGFIAVAAGGSHSLGLKSDGSIVAWGDNTSGQATPPAGNNFIAIVAGGEYSLGLVSSQINQTSPQRVLSPVVGEIAVGSCSGTKWCFNQHKECDSNGIGHCPGGGINGTDDTNAWDLNLYNDLDNGKPVYATAPGVVADTFAGVENPSDSYGRVLIEHDYYGNKWWSGYLHMKDINVINGQHVDSGTIIGYISHVSPKSIPNHLHFAVYRGSNTTGGLISFDVPIVARTISLQTAPEVNIAPLPDPIEADEPQQDKLIIITHGWLPPPYDTEPGWMERTYDAINAMIASGDIDQSWKVLMWPWPSAYETPWQAVSVGPKHGKNLGHTISNPRWQHVHLIGHSAGAAVIGAAAKVLTDARAAGTFTGDIHLTFLDPFTSLGEDDRYGKTLDFGRDWADNYHTVDFFDATRGLFKPDTWTDTILYWTSRNFDYAHNVDISSVDRGVPNDHDFPCDWYYATITGQYPDGNFLGNDNIFEGRQYGFPRSLEAGDVNWQESLTLPVGNKPAVGSLTQRVVKIVSKKIHTFYDSYVVPSVTGIKNILGNGIRLITESPVWVHTVIEMPEGTNYIKFTYRFEGAGNGYLTAYFNENLILIGDQRLDGNDIQESGKIMVQDFMSSENWLTLRLDRIGDVNASVFVSNIEIGTITNPADFNDDLRVDMRDFASFADKWQREDCNENNSWCGGADFDKTGVVDINDILTFTENWLWVMPKHIPSDLDFSTRVDFGDFNILAGQWAVDCNSPDWCYGSDFDKSGVVDVYDLAKFTESWLSGS